MARKGRPPGVKINPVAVEYLLDNSSPHLTKQELAKAAGITPGHLADMLHRHKGASRATIDRMALALRVPAGLIAPDLTGRFIAVDAPTGDESEAA